MTRFLKISSAITYCILVLLVFLLLFQHKVTLPPWLQAAGRTHPLLLHLPIGFLVLAALLWFIRKQIEAASFYKIFNFLLHITAFTAALTALLGFFLAREDGYSTATLRLHTITGVALAFAVSLLRYLYRLGRSRLFSIALLLSLILLIASGHFGATLTHGENFVWQPFQKEKPEQPPLVTGSTPLFSALIHPLLKSKCGACHKPGKSKGGLDLSSEAGLLAGGKSGALWTAGDAAGSRLVQYIYLPEEDKKHMPPPGKPQLTADEKSLLRAWIQSGASMQKALKDFAPQDTVHIIAAKLMTAVNTGETAAVYAFPAVSSQTLQRLNTPFCTVQPLAVGSPALSAAFFVRERFDIKQLEALRAVQEQLVYLNVNNMPVTDAQMNMVAGFSNLEKLTLNNTAVTSNGLAALAGLKQLQTLSIAGTKADDAINGTLAQLPKLRDVYIWNTALQPAALQARLPRLRVHTGFVPDTAEILRLNAPIIKTEHFVLNGNEPVTLAHTLPGVTIRYTTDGTKPDSMESPIYRQPISINGFTTIKAIAGKPGWYASEMTEASFFKKGWPVLQAELLAPPNEQYKGLGATTLIDGIKGTADNFKDAAWLGYREQPFSALLMLQQPAPRVSAITVSFAKNIGSYIMPPAVVEVWAGTDRHHLKLLKTVRPVQPTVITGIVVEGISIDIPPASWPCFKITARPVNPLPVWHPGKGDKGWVFIDEIFLNE